MLYQHRNNFGCVVQRFEAVQFVGYPEPVREAFPTLDVRQLNPYGALVLSDKRRELMVWHGNWVVGINEDNTEVVVLGQNAFEDTYVPAMVDW